MLKWTADELELGLPDRAFTAWARWPREQHDIDELRAIVRASSAGAHAQGHGPAARRQPSRRAAGARSILETTREKTTAERSKREAEAREHPITKHVLQTFGAQIKEIKTDV